MMKQQTAVEWLVEKLSQLPQVDERFESEFNTWLDAHEAWDKMHDQLIEQALQMEKEQIVNAYNEKPFILSKEVSEDGAKVLFKGGEQYYSETYTPNT